MCGQYSTVHGPVLLVESLSPPRPAGDADDKDDSSMATGCVPPTHSTLTLSPLPSGRGAEGSSGGRSSRGGKPDRSRCWLVGMPSCCSISWRRSLKVAEGERVRLAALPSDEVTLILLLGEGLGGDGLSSALVGT